MPLQTANWDSNKDLPLLLSGANAIAQESTPL
jgi:hypothetical protein